MFGDYSAIYVGDWFLLIIKRLVYGYVDSYVFVYYWVLGFIGRCLICCRIGKGKNKRGWWIYKLMGIGEYEN